MCQLEIAKMSTENDCAVLKEVVAFFDCAWKR